MKIPTWLTILLILLSPLVLVIFIPLALLFMVFLGISIPISYIIEDIFSNIQYPKWFMDMRFEIWG